MYSIAKDWNPKQKKLNKLLLTKATAEEGIFYCREIHKELHSVKEKDNTKTIYGELVDKLSPAIFSYRPEKKFASIAWNLWHITRIEDAIGAIFIAKEKQVFNKEWKSRINVEIADTGNAMKPKDVDIFDKTINMKEMLAYRKEVGKRTQEILKDLDPEKVKKKPVDTQLERIMKEGVLLEDSESKWLLDFWSKKTIAGFLLLPITRHQVWHIHDGIKIREKYGKERPTIAST